MAFKIDFSGVEDKSFDITPGKYLAKVKNITKEEGSEYPYLKWELVIMSGKCKGSNINHITSLKPSALFNLRNTLIACGLNVPKAAVTLEPKKLIGKQLGVEVGEREHEGRTYPQIKKTFPASEFEDSSDAFDASDMVLSDDDF